MKFELGLCVVDQCTPEDDSHQVYAYTCMSITRRQTESILITEENRAPFHSPVDSHITRVAVLDSIVIQEEGWPEAHMT